ncbi:MAG: PAS domain S-box protein [Gemmatimonadales bacterium]
MEQKDLFSNSFDSAFFELSRVLLCIAGYDGYFKRLNAAWEKTLGYAREELLAKPWMEFVHPEDREATAATAKQIIERGEEVIDFEHRFRAKDGSYRALRWNAVPVPSQRLVCGGAEDTTELRAVREEATGLFESAPDALIIVDQKGRITKLNAQAERLFGYSRDELMHRPIEILIPQRLRSAHRQHRARYLTDARPRPMGQEFTLSTRRSDGSEVPVEVSLSPVRTAEDTMVAAAVRDVTQHVAAAEAIRRSERTFRAIFERSAVGVARVDLDGRALETNRALQEMLGYSADELRGKHFSAVTHQDDVEAELRLFAELLEGKRDHYRLNKRYLRKDGSIIWGRVIGSLVRDDQGTPIFGIGLVEDLTAERKRAAGEERLLRAQRSLRLSETRYGDLVEHSLGMICTHDFEGTMLMVNSATARTLGYQPEELVGRNLAELTAPEARGELAEYLRRVKADGRAEGVFRLRSKSGEDRFIEYRNVVRSEAGESPYVLAHGQDVTEKHSLEGQLRQAQKLEAVGQLIGGIAHDFNNILTVILGNVELIEASLGPDHEWLRADLADLKGAAKSGAELVARLLGFSRRAELTMGAVNVMATLREITSMLRRIMPESISVELREPHRDLLPIHADAAAVQQIILNLATNARDAMPDGGTFTIEPQPAWLDEQYEARHPWVTPGEYVCVSCMDTGTGMDEDTQSKVFDPFFTTKAPGSGTGLGMAMTYGLMKQHGGFVNVYSELGHGTTVKLYFPLADEAEPLMSRRLREAIEAAPGRGETILVVEDEEVLRRTVRRVLEKVGYTVLEAQNGEEALATWKAHRQEIALILSDLVMPVTGGRELYDGVTGIDPDVKFIFTSGYTARDVEERAQLDANVPFLRKPWTLAEIAGKVRRVLESSDTPGRGQR